MQHICLNEDFLHVTVPHIPEALKDCIKTGMDSQSLETGENEVPVGADVDVAFNIEDPLGRGPDILIRPRVKKIQICTECERNNTFCEGENPHPKSNNEEATTLNLGIALGTLIPVILLCCVAGLFLVFKKRSSKGKETFQDQDDNPVYGIYACDGTDTTEATDTNEVYGEGEEA